MSIDGTWRRTPIRGALRAAAVAAALAGWIASQDMQAASRARAGAAQSTAEDPCRFFTAEEMGKAFGRQLKSSKLTNICDYRGPGTDRVVVKVSTGPEGTIFRHVKATSATGDKSIEKVSTAAGEAYFDSTLPVFIGRVGNYEVQIETTIQPTPKDAAIKVGGRIMESLARK